MNVNQSRRFPPELTGTHREVVVGYRYLPAEKGAGKKGKDINASFEATVKIIDSENANAVGRTHTLRFWLNGQYQQYADRERLAFLTACAGTVPEDESFDEIAVGQMLVDADEDGELHAEGDDAIVILHTRTSKTKERPAIKNGQAVVEEFVVANDFFYPAT